MAKHSSHNDGTRTYVSIAKGTTVGHYRIIEKIGSGDMDEVYLAEDIQLDNEAIFRKITGWG